MIFFGVLVLTACSFAVKPHEHSTMDHMAMAPASNKGWSIDDRSTSGSITFAVMHSGSVVKQFDVRHEKKLHLIVVRSDLTHFQHLHPTMKKDGTWIIPFTSPADGTYWIYADFIATGEGDHVLKFEKVYGSQTKEAYEPEIYRADAGLGEFVMKRIDDRNFAVSMTALTQESVSSYQMHWFITSPLGDDIPVEEYLGANGHSVWISPSGDYIHTHPFEDYAGFKKGDAPVFIISNPRDSSYRTFTQIKIKGKLYTIDIDWPFKHSR